MDTLPTFTWYPLVSLESSPRVCDGSSIRDSVKRARSYLPDLLNFTTLTPFMIPGISASFRAEQGQFPRQVPACGGIESLVQLLQLKQLRPLEKALQHARPASA